MLFTVCFLAGAGIAERREAEAFDPNPIIAINVQDPNGLAGPGLVHAKELASEIYEQVGVRLRWSIDETTKSDRTLTVVLATSVTSPAGVSLDSMGVAPSPGDGTRGTTACLHRQGDGVRFIPPHCREVRARVRIGPRDRPSPVTTECAQT